jgi:cell division protein FtsB
MPMDSNGAVDVSAAVAQLDETIAALEAEVENDERAINVKRARLNALRKGRRGLEAAADPDIEPLKRGGRKPKATAETPA